MEAFSNRIKELRNEMGYGVREMAAMLGISHSTLLNYEGNKRTADIDILKKYTEIFNVSGDYLLGLTDERR